MRSSWLPTSVPFGNVLVIVVAAWSGYCRQTEVALYSDHVLIKHASLSIMTVPQPYSHRISLRFTEPFHNFDLRASTSSTKPCSQASIPALGYQSNLFATSLRVLQVLAKPNSATCSTPPVNNLAPSARLTVLTMLLSIRPALHTASATACDTSIHV